MTDLDWLRKDYEDLCTDYMINRKAEITQALALIGDVELTPTWEGVKRRLEDELARLEARS